MKFVHAADIHLDSPFKELARYEAAPRDRLLRAAREAFSGLVNLALKEEVAFVVLAGDLFDGDWRDMNTGLWLAAQFRRLEQAQIPVYMLRGNHDAESEVARKLTWPGNVFEFSTRAPQTFRVERHRVALHGQGFARREVTENLARNYPSPVPGHFNLGVLHSNVGGLPDHDSYAPASLPDLLSRGYDYWALGHIHQRSVLHERPHIVYPGNLQGRHIREAGAKGCYLVTVRDGQVAQAEFRPLDLARWHPLEVTLHDDDRLDDLYDLLRRKLRQLVDEHEHRLALVRLKISGPCAAHRQLFREGREEEARLEIRNLANEFGDEVWIEKIQFQTSAPVDLERLREGQDLLGALLRHVDELARDDDSLRELAQELQPLAARGGNELLAAGLDLRDPVRLREWLRQAEALLVAQLWEDEA